MAKNLKGGYKIVSLNGLDLVGESLAIAGLYDKLAKSYDKPILVTGIVIDGEKKKNAFVQVEVLDDGIKINDLYGYDLLVEEDGDITVSANPQELPNTADASAGQILGLDANKKPEWKDALPSTASASQGNALLLDAEKKPVWGAISGGTKWYKHVFVLSSYPYKAQVTLVEGVLTAGEKTQGSYAGKTIEFIDRNPNAYTELTEQILSSAIKGSIGFETSGYQFTYLNKIYSNASSIIGNLAIDELNGKILSFFASSLQGSDTVTAL